MTVPIKQIVESFMFAFTGQALDICTPDHQHPLKLAMR